MPYSLDAGRTRRQAQRQAKVGYLRYTPERCSVRLDLDEHVARVQVPMDDAPLVDVLHPPRNVQRELQDAVEQRRADLPAVEEPRQRAGRVGAGLGHVPIT